MNKSLQAKIAVVLTFFLLGNTLVDLGNKAQDYRPNTSSLISCSAESGQRNTEDSGGKNSHSIWIEEEEELSSRRNLLSPVFSTSFLQRDQSLFPRVTSLNELALNKINLFVSLQKSLQTISTVVFTT